MKRSCQHCGELIVGDAYRVTSEEDNVTLLLIWLFALSVLWRRKDLGCVWRKSVLAAKRFRFEVPPTLPRPASTSSDFHSLLLWHIQLR